MPGQPWGKRPGGRYNWPPAIRTRQQKHKHDDSDLFAFLPSRSDRGPLRGRGRTEVAESLRTMNDADFTEDPKNCPAIESRDFLSFEAFEPS
jgi:hypothetical protein